MEWIKKMNDNLQPYYGLLVSIAFFGATFVAGYKFLFAPTDLKVTVLNEQMNYPSSIGEKFEEICAKIPNEDSLKYNQIAVYNFLIQTSERKTITIANVTDKTLRRISFKHLNTEAVTAYSISSDFLNNQEEKNLYDNLEHDQKRGLIYLKQLIDLPPNKSIKIQIWGSFKKSILEDDLLVSYDEGDAFFEKNYNISGIKGYLIYYSFEFVIILMLIFVGVYYFSLKYAIRKNLKADS